MDSAASRGEGGAHSSQRTNIKNQAESGMGLEAAVAGIHHREKGGMRRRPLGTNGTLPGRPVRMSSDRQSASVMAERFPGLSERRAGGGKLFQVGFYLSLGGRSL